MHHCLWEAWDPKKINNYGLRAVRERRMAICPLRTRVCAVRPLAERLVRGRGHHRISGVSVSSHLKRAAAFSAFLRTAFFPTPSPVRMIERLL